MIPVKEALDRINTNCLPLEEIQLPIQEAVGYVLATDIEAHLDMPPFDQSAMDGYAVNWNDTIEQYTVIGVIQAGDDADGISLSPGECARIYTGEMVPKGANTVIQQENVIHEDNIIRITDGKAGLNIRSRGEQYTKGEKLISKGHILNPGSVGFIASNGFTHLTVTPEPRIKILVTGNELGERGNPLHPGQIYESNSVMLLAALKSFGFDAETEKVEDDLNTLKIAVARALDTADMVLISGGISVGDYDFVRQALTENGVEEVFYKVRQKPGKPLYFGRKERKVVFGLPGNPSSALTSFYIYVLKAIEGLTNRSEPFLEKTTVTLEHDFMKKGTLTNFIRARITGSTVQVLSHQSSAMLNAWRDSNAILIIPDEFNACEKGQQFEAFKLPL
ncbi:MAG: molybdopterin molybdenumtransferase MoeA [Bacteroidetes bacterium]|nr:MAG: molybdopterin molybdenumtransferase MoeA [Bacteroidota bacterium]